MGIHSFQQEYPSSALATYPSNDTFPPHLTYLLFSIYHFTAFYYLAVFIPFGIVFNLLIFLIFLKLPLGTPSTRVYYIAMAFGEVGTLLITDPWFFWRGVGWPTVAWDPLGPLNPHSSITDIWFCKAVVFVWFALEMSANLTFVVFAIERVIAIYFPLKALSFTQERSMLTIAIVFVFSTLVSGICLQITRRRELKYLMPHDEMCSFDTEQQPQNLLLGALVYCCAFIVPAILSSICSILISFKIISR